MVPKRKRKRLAEEQQGRMARPEPMAAKKRTHNRRDIRLVRRGKQSLRLSGIAPEIAETRKTNGTQQKRNKKTETT
jgi:hypothetical protein